MQTASLVVAICGLVLACLSLGWQAANYVLTGGRVKVLLRVGAMNGRNMVTAPPSSLRPEWLQELAEQGYSAPVVAVRVANVGRQPVTVVRWSLVAPQGVSLSPIADSIGPALPHRLEVGESETWAVEMRSVQHFLRTTKEMLGNKPVGRGGLFSPARPVPVEVCGQVELADGRTRRSGETLR